MERQFVGLGQQKHQNQRIGVFVDCANIQISAKRVYQSGLNYADILLAATDSRKLAYAIVYCVESEDSEPGAYYEFLRKSGYDVKIKDLKVFRDGSKKGDWDIGICIDADKKAGDTANTLFETARNNAQATFQNDVRTCLGLPMPQTPPMPANSTSTAPTTGN